MSDETWRALENAWRADPGDQVLLERAALARRRAGVAVTGDMLDARVRPGRVLESSLALAVSVELPSGEVVLLGHAGREPVAVPPHRLLWVDADAGDASELARLVDELVEREIPGLRFPLTRHWDRRSRQLLLRARQLELLGLSYWEPDWLEDLAGLPSLAVLELHGRPLRSGDVPELRAVRDLTRLSALVESPTIPALATLRNLRHLHLDVDEHAEEQDPHLSSLETLEALQSLRLGRTWRVGTEAGGGIARLARLRTLDVRECALDDGGLAAIASLPGLESLNVSRCYGPTADGRAVVGRLATLQRLDVGWTPCEDAALSQIAGGLSRLRRLSLAGCRVTDLTPLAGLDALEELDVSWCPLPAGAEKVLGPRVRVVRTDPRARLDSLHGHAPVQGEGEVLGLPFYFRARGETWTFGVAREPGGDATSEIYRGGDYGSNYDASYMPEEDALELIRRSLADYLSGAPPIRLDES